MNAQLPLQHDTWPVLEHEELLDAGDEDTTVKTARPSWAVEAPPNGGFE